MPHTPLHAVRTPAAPPGRRRRPATILNLILDAITAHPELAAQLDLDETGIAEPGRGRPVSLALHFRDGDTAFIDAIKAEEE